jgi:poly-gamma-glutamate biosynthesis protein PgsC/CapC
VHEYFFRTEIVRLALVLGVVVSMLFYERMQLTSGGAIVPAYVALFLPAPLYVLATIVAGYLTYVAVSVVLARRVIVYGRRKFQIEVIVGLGIVVVGSAAAHAVGAADPTFLGLSGIGLVVPGVLGHDMFRQGPPRTLAALAATSAIVALAVYLFVSLVSIAPIPVQIPPAPATTATAYPLDLLLPAVIVGVLLGIAVFGSIGLRSGGFVTGAYLALMLDRPLDLLFAAGAAILTWLIVSQLLMPRILIFGRRKFSAMILVGTMVTWSAELAITALTGGAYVPWRGFTVVAVIVPALLANDAQRQGLLSTAVGAAIVALGVFGFANLLAGVLSLA